MKVVNHAARFSAPNDLIEAMGIEFSPEQLAAITAPLEPAVIIAGAGSGKTTVMAARVVWLVGTGQVRPDQVLGLTFTRKAAGELAGRVRAALERAQVLTEGVDDQGEEVMMTYDAFAGRLVREHGGRVGAETNPMMISGAARYRLASRVVLSAPGPLLHLSRLRPASLTERVLELDASMAAHLADPEAIRARTSVFLAALDQAPGYRGREYASIAAARAAALERVELLDLVATYRQLKTSLGLVEFADQMAIAADLVSRVPVVADRVREQFAVVLLDEYQDTSSAQAQLLRGLFSGPDRRHGLGHPVTAVGDPFQAIYGWRGAAASNILAFHADFPRLDLQAPHGVASAARYQLSVNRRSGQQILDVANDIAAELRHDPVLTRHDPTGQQTPAPLRAPEQAAPAAVEVASFDTWPQEVDWIADQIVERHQSGQVERWDQIAVLLRRNADLGPIHQDLVAREVPVEIVGLGGLLALPEVAEVVAMLRMINDVTANPDTVAVLTGPRYRVGPRDLALLGRRARELALAQPGDGSIPDLMGELAEAVADTDPAEVVSLLDAVADPGELAYSPQALERFGRLATELAQLRRHVAEPVLDQVRRVITAMGLDVELAAMDVPGLGHRADQLAAFTDAVAGYVDVDGDASLTGLLAWLHAESDHGMGLEQATPSDRNSVKLLTVHRAKGLEWDVVHLPGLVNDVFPSDRVSDNWVRSAAVLPAPLRGDADSIPQLDEVTDASFKQFQANLKDAAQLAEDRLAYVAVTRARRQLVASAHTWRSTVTRPRAASTYFLAAADEALRQGRVSAIAPEPAAVNPIAGGLGAVSWPEPLDSEQRTQRRWAAEQVELARAQLLAGHQVPDRVDLDEQQRIEGWDHTMGLLLAEQRQGRERLEPVVPSALSASAVVNLHRDRAGYERALARPMPRQISSGASRGTRFHDWLRLRLGGAGIDDPLPLEAAEPIPDDRALKRLIAAFEQTQWAQLTPAAVEVPFVLTVGDRLIRGQIDAVFPSQDADHDYWVVDWKTSGTPADPWQLGIYRLAWAQAQGIDPSRVRAGFVHITQQRTEWVDQLPSLAELEAVLGSSPG